MSTQHRHQVIQQTKPQRPDTSFLRPPKSNVARFFWRWKVWVGGTFATSMMEPWETLVLFSFFTMFIFLLIGGIYRYLPSQVAFLAGRARYYLVGTDSNGAVAGTWSGTKEL